MYQPIALTDPNRMNLAMVRIYESESSETIIGGGFLVTYGQIITCAHVVAEATKQELPIAGYENFVWIDYPFIPNSPRIRARVEANVPAGHAYDIAKLYPDYYIPGSMPAPLCRTKFTKPNQTVTCIGFPRGMKDGISATGTVSQRNAKYWYQIDNAEITNGFSGCPVWHNELGGIVGMVTHAVENMKKSAAFLIPASMILQQWGELPLSWEAELPGSIPFGRLYAPDGFLYNYSIDESGQFKYA